MSVRRRLDSAVTSAAWLLRGRMYEGHVVIMLKENNRTFIPLNKKNMVNFRTESIFFIDFPGGARPAVPSWYRPSVRRSQLLADLRVATGRT